MAHAVTAMEPPTTPDDRPIGETPVHPQAGAVPLLRAIALQRPLPDLIQLMDLLDRDDQQTHAGEILTAAATLRPVDDVAALMPLLDAPQATDALHAAATRRPVEELAQLVRQLHTPPAPPAPAQPAGTGSSTTHQTRWKLTR